MRNLKGIAQRQTSADRIENVLIALMFLIFGGAAIGLTIMIFVILIVEQMWFGLGMVTLAYGFIIFDQLYQYKN